MNTDQPSSPAAKPIAIRLGTRAYAPDQPPAGIRRLEEPAVWVSQEIRLHLLWSSAAEPFGEAPRAVKTEEGDLLVIFPVGTAHTWGKLEKVNRMVALRSADGGRTWSAPVEPWRAPYNQHAWNPLIPRGSSRIYSAAMEAPFAELEQPHNGPLGLRWSDDDGRTWSALAPTELVHPDAPPMIFALAEPGHLLALTHRAQASDPDWNHMFPDRQSLWCQVSRDAGATWSEPRFLIADVAPYGGPDNIWVEVGYADVVVDGDELHIFLDYKKSVILHLRLRLDNLNELPSEQELSAGGDKREK